MKNKEKKNKKKSSWKERLIIIALSLIMAAAVLSVGVAYLFNGRFLQEGGEGGVIDPGVITPPEIKEDMVNMLICGIDYEEGTGRGKLTDVIMLASFDITKKQVNVLQIPRDTYIGDDYPTGKINAIYNQSTNGGMDGLSRRIYKLFQVTVDHYMTITMDEFIRVVDKIGGVDVNVPKTISLDGKTIPAGLQHLNGEQAEVFVRVRKAYANGDLGRMEMQKVFLEALLTKIFSMGKGQMLSLIPGLFGDVTTDMSLGEALDFYNKLVTVDKSKDITFHQVPVFGASYGGLSVVSMDKDKTAELLNTYFRPYSSAVAAQALGIEELS